MIECNVFGCFPSLKPMIICHIANREVLETLLFGKSDRCQMLK